MTATVETIIENESKSNLVTSLENAKEVAFMVFLENAYEHGRDEGAKAMQSYINSICNYFSLVESIEGNRLEMMSRFKEMEDTHLICRRDLFMSCVTTYATDRGVFDPRMKHELEIAVYECHRRRIE